MSEPPPRPSRPVPPPTVATSSPPPASRGPPPPVPLAAKPSLGGVGVGVGVGGGSSSNIHRGGRAKPLPPRPPSSSTLTSSAPSISPHSPLSHSNDSHSNHNNNNNNSNSHIGTHQSLPTIPLMSHSHTFSSPPPSPSSFPSSSSSSSSASFSSSPASPNSSSSSSSPLLKRNSLVGPALTSGIPPPRPPPSLPGGASSSAIQTQGPRKIIRSDSPQQDKYIASEVTLTTVNPEIRRKIASEILETEKSYLNSLDVIVNSYLHPLGALSADMKPKIKPIFGNIETLLGINKDLYDRLEGLIGTNWDETVCLGTVFLSVAPFLKMYTVYSNQYNDALKLLQQMMEDPLFSEAIERIHNERLAANPNALKLEHLLIMPIQRVPRYNLLLTDLIKKTPQEHPDFEDLNKSLLIMKEVANHINKSVETAENLRKIISSTGNVKGLVEAHRRLIHDGVLSIQQSATIIGESSEAARRFGFLSGGTPETQKFHLFLFNDRLLFAPEKDILRQKDLSKIETNWPLNLVWVQSGRDDTFRILGPNMVFYVLATPEEKTKWVPILNDTISAALNELGLDPENRQGSFEFIAGSVYTGNWVDGRMSGFGTFTFCGNVYEGNWLDSQKDGDGTLKSVAGETYVGKWFDNLPHGQGVIEYPDGSSYRGNFERGMFHDENGLFQWPNGDSYQGGFSQDLFSGYGSLKFSKSSSYVGEFKEGRFHGQGTLTLDDGSTYKGQWRAGSRSGSGILHSSDGSSYDGEWSANLQHGKGKYIGSNGTTYDGKWTEGKMEGKGVLTSKFGVWYSGKWKNGVPHGKGEIRFENGETFSGMWREGRFHGAGVLVKANNVKIEGIWNEGRLEGKFSVITTALPPIRCNAKGERVLDITCQVPGHPGPVFFDLPPEIPHFEACPSALLF